MSKLDHKKSDSITNVVLQLDAVPVGPSAACVSTKESFVDPSGNDPDMGDSEKCGLYVEENPPRPGSTIVHNIPLCHDQVKVGVEEVRDADAPIPVPTQEVQLVGQALNTFITWQTHLGFVGPAKPADRPDHDVDDLLYLMTLTIPEFFLKPLQVMWDATVFGVFNDNFPLYIKHEDLSEIAHDGNADVYGFLKPQSIQRSSQSQFESESYIKNWMQNSKRDVYLGAYLNRLDNYLKGIINRSVIFFNTFTLALVRNINILIVQHAFMFVLNNALKRFDDTPQSKSKAAARQKGSTECEYYIMHWISTIILGSFKNNWETTIGTRDIEGASHLVGKLLFKC
ncbi:hypothetical protein HKD37_19G053127 [Glycine soja]